ncbi:MAG: response regulator [Natronomonas sp.]
MANIADEISILHVEDNSSFAELTTTFLEREDNRFTIETAARPDEGLERLEQEDFDCVVSDYDMPGQNGIEFLKIFRKEHESRPFILFTGKGSEQVASDAIAAGVTDYLQKGGGSEIYSLLANRISNSVEQYRSKCVRSLGRSRLL